MVHKLETNSNFLRPDKDLDVGRIKALVESDLPLVEVKGTLALTKSESGHSKARLLRSQRLEEVTKQLFGPADKYFERLKNYDSSFNQKDWPNHYAVRGIEGTGNALSGENVFIPMTLGSDRPSDQLGLELIDCWYTLFSLTILPAIKHLFDRDSLECIFQFLDHTILGIVIYWTALAHEWGHMVGPFKVLPPTEEFRKLSKLLQGLMGETAANATAALLTPERPEIALWILLFHLGYTGRKGFRVDSVKGLMNVDPDVFSAVLIYQYMVRVGVLELTFDSRLHLNLELLLPGYSKLRDELDTLANQAFHLSVEQCNQVFLNWMAEQIPFDVRSGCFLFPDSLRKLYNQVQLIPEQPHYEPLLPFISD